MLAAVTDGTLSPAARAFRAGHAAIAVGFLAAIANIWWCALTGGTNRLLRPAIAALAVEGAVVAANDGDCPLRPLQARVGDPVPLFELVLSPRAARQAVPILGLIAVAGVVAVIGRGGLTAARCSAQDLPRI